MISILTWSYDRQGMYDITLPLWLKQEGVEFEIIAGHGPKVTVPIDDKIVPVLTTEFKMCKAYNALLAKSKGDMLLITQADMQVNDPKQLARMLSVWTPGTMVTERFFKNGKRDVGIHLQFMLVEKKEIVKAGGWCELFDFSGLVCCEDADLCSSMLENGCNYLPIETPEDIGVYHIHHERPDYQSPEMIAKAATALKFYRGRHKDYHSVLYAKQFAMMMMAKRFNGL